jgi:hypothetical protein
LNAELSELHHVERLGAKRKKVIGPQDEGADFDPSSQLDPKFGINVDDVDDDQAAFAFSDKLGGTGDPSAQQPPRRVMFTPRMKDGLDAFFRMTQDDSQPKRRVRSLQVACATYGFGDASEDGFGAAFLLPDGKIYYRHGVWDWRISNEHSSNYQELRNLVESLEKAAAAGLLTNSEVWFTNNTTAEATYFRGSSKSRQLHGLVLRLRLLEMRLGIIIRVGENNDHGWCGRCVLRQSADRWWYGGSKHALVCAASFERV